MRSSIKAQQIVGAFDVHLALNTGSTPVRILVSGVPSENAALTTPAKG
jgi:hypothetical protein